MIYSSNMCDHICFIVPPHLLAAMAESQDDGIRQLGVKTLSMCQQIHQRRHQFLRDKLANPNHGDTGRAQGIVPNVLLEHISQAQGVDETVKKSAQKSLALGM